jgi:predicted transcriptional regulator
MTTNTEKNTVTFLREKTKVDTLDTIANALDRPRSYIINKALDEYIEFHNRQLEKIDRGLSDAKAGKFATKKELAETFSGDFL